MPWSDVPTFLKQVFGYFGEEQHENRVLRKFIGLWDEIRPGLTVLEKDERELKKMDRLRKELR